MNQPIGSTINFKIGGNNCSKHNKLSITSIAEEKAILEKLAGLDLDVDEIQRLLKRQGCSYLLRKWIRSVMLSIILGIALGIFLISI